MGLMVNKPAPELRLSDVLDQLVDDTPPQAKSLAVHFGGPVETGRGFVRHSDEYRSALETLRVGDGIALTATRDILEDIATGKGPERAQLMLGYAGWGPGQLADVMGAESYHCCWKLSRCELPLTVFTSRAESQHRKSKSHETTPLAPVLSSSAD